MGLRERFMKKVIPEPNTGCWLWIGAITTSGYGQIRGDGTDGGRHGAHQASWMLEHGPIPNGLYVCHRCDVRACVNPNHLFLGTHQDNMDDMNRKGRGRKRRGEDAPRAKLTNQKVLEIKKRLASGEYQHDIAASFGVASTTISHISTGRLWSHVVAT